MAHVAPIETHYSVDLDMATCDGFQRATVVYSPQTVPYG